MTIPRLLAVSDLHVHYPDNRDIVENLQPTSDGDWLIVAGDVAEQVGDVEWALGLLRERFATVIWVPGNHDLWTIPTKPGDLRGEEKYLRQVEICREYGVLTPEDPYVVWPGEGSTEGPRCILAPLFLLYDYSFRPDEVPQERAIEWAAEENLLCSDEVLLHPDPFLTKQDWCRARCEQTEPRLVEAAARGPLVLINHFPLRQDLAVLPRIPRFSIWCGTRRTEDWHVRFRAEVVIYGHLHIRATHYRDDVRFEEVSLGYPQNYDPDRGVAPYLRQILPHPAKGPARPRPLEGSVGRPQG